MADSIRVSYRMVSLWREIRKSKWSYVFISPFFILFAIFGIFPPLYSLYLSFQRWDGLTPPRYIGILNYIRVINDSLFWKAFLNNVIFLATATVPMLFLAMVIAFILHSSLVKYRHFFRTTYFSPIVTSTVAITLLFTTIYGVNYGIINSLLRLLGMKGTIYWLTNPFWMKVALVLLLIWRWLGWNVVLYEAGLQSIPSELYDAAKIDGAATWQLFLHIVLPLIKPVILFTFVISCIGMIQLFTEPRLLVPGGLGGTDYSLLTMMLYLYQTGFNYFRFGMASAMASVMLLIIIGFTIANFRLLGSREG